MKNWPELSLERDPDYQGCFGCGRDNPLGFKLSFRWDGRVASSEFTPEHDYQGWPGLLHGGITACLLDEAMGYAALFEVGRCVTAKMNIKLTKPVPVGKKLRIAASIRKKSRKLVETEARITLEDGTLVAEGVGTHFVVIPNGSTPSPGSMTEAKKA
jgi:uncharacterized protein (TIGR00369 family)